MTDTPKSGSPAGYNRFLLLVAGLGGLLYGIDIGIIDPALGYLGKTISMTEEKKSIIVAAVLGGSIIAGFFADLLGRKLMMLISAVMFVASCAIIFTSRSYVPLLLGRILQGMSGGVIAVGPGVCVWLALSELMPTRIRSVGMGFALLINQGVSTGIAALFLPIVGNYGFSAMFGFWAACTVIYLITAAFFLPETKGRTLEEIEAYFDGRKPA